MAQNADLVYKTTDQIVAQVLSAWQVRFPDAVIGPDAVFRLWTEVFGDVVSGVYLSQQLLSDDSFISTMSALALIRAGDQFGRPQKAGTISTGSVRFSGAGGTFIDIGTAVAAPLAGSDDALIFTTSAVTTIPSPGDAIAPTTAVGATGLLTGTYEYAVTFTTAEGETQIGDSSDPLTVATKKITVDNLPIGGPGTVARNVYRRVNGGLWGFLAAVADNTTTLYGDDNTVSVTTAPPDTSTAERVTVAAQSNDVGLEYNVAVGTITDLSDVPSGVTDVINLVGFTGGTDTEDIEVFRGELLKHTQNPGSGSGPDLVDAVTKIEGIDSASVFKNVDLAGDPALGTVVIRIAGPAGAIPSSDLIDQAQATAEAADLANITILVGTFDPLDINPAVAITVQSGYVLADVSPSVKQAITDYINSVPVGGTVYSAGIYSAVFGLAGVNTLVVSAPSAPGTTAGDTEKPVPGTITVT